MQDSTYAQQLNRRLTAAKLLLALESEKSINSMPVGRQAIVDSALLQFYFAISAYLNEVLLHHRKALIDSGSFNLDAVFCEREAEFEEINEFRLLKDWSRKNNNILQELVALPCNLIQLAPKQAGQPAADDGSSVAMVKPANLIAVSKDVKTMDLNNKNDVRKVIESFQLFVDAQRENQVEY